MHESKTPSTPNARTVLRQACRVAMTLIVTVLAGCNLTFEPAQPAPGTTLTQAVTDYNVVILVIDGPRYTETFGDPAHTYIPRMWNEMRPQGTLFTSFRNEGWTSTVPGHTSILTGTWQHIANDGTERPTQPTLFEYYRAATGAPASKAYIISGKSKLDVCAFSTDPGYGSTVGATAIVGLASDQDVYSALISTLQNQRPRVVMATFPNVDQMGHSGVWDDYVDAIAGADSLMANAWAYIQSDTFYTGRTYVFVTNDHGRHDDANGGFQNHGDSCEGCRHISCLALGPDIRQGYTVSNIFMQRDIGVTAAAILDVSAPDMMGLFMQDMFEPVNTGVRD
jgi:hypothetical protein